MYSYHLPEIPSNSLDTSVTSDLHDTRIEVCDRATGDVKIIDANSNVLRKRCEYFNIALSEKWARRVNNQYKLRLDVSYEAFEIILNGINNGTIIVKNPNTDILMELMLASDILLLHEFYNFLRAKLDEKKDKNKEWSDQDIVSISKVSYLIASAQDIYLICQDILAERPSILFGSPEFLSIDEDLLLRILNLDLICLPEITIFNRLIEWGIHNTPNYDTLTDDSSRINALGVTLENALQLIRYSNLSPKDRSSTLYFAQILPAAKTQKQIPPRINSPIEPTIISSRFAGLISTWIDRQDPTQQYTGVNTPFEFRLVFRMDDRTTFYDVHHKYYNGSSDRFLPTIKGHHGPSLMIMKLSSGKIIGAYNPIDWKQDIPKKMYACTTESFIFSSEDRYGTNHRLSRVRDFDCAICLESVKPSGVLLKFGEDLVFHYVKRYVTCQINNRFYEHPAILDEGGYQIVEWEIFRISRKDDQPIVVINEEIKNKILPPIKSPTDAKIIDSHFLGLIATWIGRKDPVNSRYTNYNMPFQFTTLFRMKGDETFCEERSEYYNQLTDRLLPTMKCHHGPSLMLIKLKTSGKIIGAYNPIHWGQDSGKLELQYQYTSESFIFSGEDAHGKNNRLSRVKNSYQAVLSSKLTSLSPSGIKVPDGMVLGFGNTLRFFYNEGNGRPPSVVCRISNDGSYEGLAIMPSNDYEIDEWEILRVTMKDNRTPSQIDARARQKSFSKRARSRVAPYVKPNKTIDYSFSYCDISDIVDDEFFATIATWIDRRDSPYSNDDMPFQFKCLFKMNDKSFPQKYTNQSTYNLLPTMKCHHGPSLMIIRIKDSEDIIGAYNPINWQLESSNFGNDKYVHTSESFIFCEDQLRRVKNFDKAISQTNAYPNGVLLKFGQDLIFRIKSNGFYEQPTIFPEGVYEISDWEVFR
ncbi:15517_t:CDS:2, partial [Acaulospora morrowiae]